MTTSNQQILSPEDLRALLQFAGNIRRGGIKCTGGSIVNNTSGITINVPARVSADWALFDKIVSNSSDDLDMNIDTGQSKRRIFPEKGYIETRVYGNLPNPVDSGQYMSLHLGNFAYRFGNGNYAPDVTYFNNQLFFSANRLANDVDTIYACRGSCHIEFLADEITDQYKTLTTEGNENEIVYLDWADIPNATPTSHDILADAYSYENNGIVSGQLEVNYHTQGTFILKNTSANTAKAICIWNRLDTSTEAYFSNFGQIGEDLWPYLSLYQGPVYG